jgi:hypothetical protein
LPPADPNWNLGLRLHITNPVNTGNKPLPPPRRILTLFLAVFSRKLLWQGKDYILLPLLLCRAQKAEAFAFFPTNIWSHAFCFAWPWGEIVCGMATNWHAALFSSLQLQEAFFLDLCLPLPGTL